MSVNIGAITDQFGNAKPPQAQPNMVTSSPSQAAQADADPDAVNDIFTYMVEHESELVAGRWEAPDTSSKILRAILQGYPSQSEADQAFATKIALEAARCGVPADKLRATVEAVFNRSGLATRDKWQNRSDYRDRTIGKAVESTQFMYTGQSRLPIRDADGEEGKSQLDIHDGILKLSKAEPPDRDYIIDPVLHAGKSSVLAGLGGVSKTQLAAQLGVCIVLDDPFMDCDTKQGNVLLCMAEEEQAEIIRRINADIRYNNRSNAEIQQIRDRIRAFGLVGQDTRLNRKLGGALEVTGFGDEIIRLADEFGDVRLIVLDHVGLFHGGDFNAREDAALTMRIVNHIAEETGAAVMLLAHSPKTAFNADASDASQVAGSTAFVDQARSALILATMRPTEAKTYGIHDDMRKSYVSLTVTKNNYGPTGEMYWFKREPYDGVGLLEHVALSKPLPTVNIGFDLENRIRDFVASHPGQFSKTKLRDTHSGKSGRFKASKGEMAAAIEEMLSDGMLVNRDPTEAERKKFDHGPRVTQVLVIGGVDV